MNDAIGFNFGFLFEEKTIDTRQQFQPFENEFKYFFGFNVSTCLTSAKGCFGYHAGDDSLDNSTRFLANDTWAQLATSSREIMYNSGPVPGGEFIDFILNLKLQIEINFTSDCY
jgi:hypothetical protein